MISLVDVSQSIPLMILLVCGLMLMLADGFELRGMLPSLAGVGLLLSAIVAFPGLLHSEKMQAYYGGMIYFGGLASIVHLFLCISGILTLFFVSEYLQKHQEPIGESYALIVFSLIGMIMMATANDLMIIFIGLEIFSVCLYIMAGLLKKDGRSLEAGLKYFLLGAFASAFLLYGMSLLYGIAGTTNLSSLFALDYTLLQSSVMFYPAVGLILVGYLFKAAAFPFHAWTPDVYTGAPTPFAGFMATASKLTVFISFVFLLHFLRVIPTGETALDSKFITILGILAFASMLYGNIVAAQQTNVKRILAYSSIAHTGYLLLGLCAGIQSFEAVLFYLFVYMLMMVGSFGVITLLENKFSDTELDGFKGLSQKSPLLAMLMSVFLFSLAGIPPLAGFMGKYQIFLAAIQAKQTFLAVLGILTSVVGAYYYIRIIMVMYFQKPVNIETEVVPTPQRITPPIITLALIAALLILFGVYPSIIINVVDTFYNASGLIVSK